MSKRLLGVLTAVLLVLGVLAVPAFAVESGTAEEGGAPPSLEEIRARNENNPLADDVLPQAAEEPSWTQWLYYPLIIAGVLMLVLLGWRYLQWQPRFAEERRRRGRR